MLNTKKLRIEGIQIKIIWQYFNMIKNQNNQKKKDQKHEHHLLYGFLSSSL